MINSKVYYRRRLLFLIVLIVYLSQIIAIAADANQSVNDIYIWGKYLFDLHNKYKNKEATKEDGVMPYEHDAYYKFDIVTQKLTKMDNRRYPNKVYFSPDAKWAIELIETKIDENHMDVKRLLYSADNPAYVMKVGARYAWSPQGDRISYLVCKPNCPNFEDCPYQSTCDAWIYNMITNSNKKLNVNAHDVSWPSFDNNIYFNLSPQWEPPKIIRYHPDSGKFEETPYQGLNFSPSGKYYIKESFSTEPYYIYQRDPHKELIEIERQLDNQNGVHRYGGGIWLADGHTLLIDSRFVYDLDKGTFTKTMKEGTFLGLNRAKTHAVFMTGIDQFKVVDLLAP